MGHFVRRHHMLTINGRCGLRFYARSFKEARELRQYIINCQCTIRIQHDFYQMHFMIDLKLVASFSFQFFISGKYPLDMIYRNLIFYSAIVFEKFTARIFGKESAPVII